MSGFQGRTAPGTITLERYERLQRMNPLIAQGGYSNQELSARFGVSPEMIAIDKDYIIKNWWASERNEEVKLLRVQRIAELEQIKRLALESYHRSRQDKEEITTRYDNVLCEDCNGTGRLPQCKCLNCDGTGRVNEEVVTRKVSGQAGDSPFLEVARKCTVEIAKMEALYAQPEVKVQHVISGEASVVMTIEQKYKEADPELIIQAKAALARLEESAKKTVQGQVVKAVENTVPE